MGEAIDWSLIDQARAELDRAQSELLSAAVGLDSAAVVRFASVATACSFAAAGVQSALTVRSLLPPRDSADV
jgi:hypothetical protein